MNDLLLLLTGALLCDSVPHLASGLTGSPFPTPFAKPHGIGFSAPLVNFLWGAFNLVMGLAILAAYPVTIGFNDGFIAMLFGSLALGAYMSFHFGRVRSGALSK